MYNGHYEVSLKSCGCGLTPDNLSLVSTTQSCFVCTVLVGCECCWWHALLGMWGVCAEAHSTGGHPVCEADWARHQVPNQAYQQELIITMVTYVTSAMVCRAVHMGFANRLEWLLSWYICWMLVCIQCACSRSLLQQTLQSLVWYISWFDCLADIWHG